MILAALFRFNSKHSQLIIDSSILLNISCFSSSSGFKIFLKSLIRFVFTLGISPHSNWWANIDCFLWLCNDDVFNDDDDDELDDNDEPVICNDGFEMITYQNSNTLLMIRSFGV